MSDTALHSPLNIVRQELRQFLSMAEKTGMDADRLCRKVGFSYDDWQSWLGVLDDAPLPSRPTVPVMLRHLGYLTSRLDRTAQEVYA